MSSSPRPDVEPKSVKITGDSSGSSTVESTTAAANKDKPPGWLKTWVGGHTQWIVRNWSWSKLKPVIRCAVVGWAAVVLFIIPKVEAFMGQASFLILVGVFFAPASDPFMSVLERSILVLLFIAIAWAWACLGIFLANLARHVHNPAATLFDVANGQYIETAPTVILGVFVFFGSAFFLYVKARQGPGPYFLPSIFACICLDISITTVVLFPFPFYLIGKAIILPLALASALSLVGSILIFPSTISAQFTSRLQDVLTPLISALDLQRTLLNTPFPNDLTQYTEKITAASNLIKGSEGALGPLAASARLMKGDLIYSRFAPVDFKPFQLMCRRMSGRTNGLATFFSLVGIGPGADSLAPNPALDTPVVGTSLFEDDKGKPQISTPPSSKVPTSSSFSQKHDHHSLLRPHTSPSYEKPSGGETEQAVGIFESQGYLNLEARILSDPNWGDWTRKSIRALGESCDTVLEVSRDGLIAVNGWLGGVRHGRIRSLLGIQRKERAERISEQIRQMKELRARISGALESFRSDRRLLILDSYQDAAVFDADEKNQMPHKYLFRSYYYQYHLIQVCAIIIQMLDEIVKLEEKRTHERLWTPVGRLITWNKAVFPEDAEHTEDDDPDVIQGLQPGLGDDDHDNESATVDDLGLPRVRDPDALPPRNSTEWAMTLVHRFIVSLGGGNVIFAVKAGLFSVLLCLPLFLKSSARFAYDNKFVWGVIMGQITLARFRGDTTYGLVSRLLSTFFGALTGLIMWYISCGLMRGNIYGLATVCGVCFPFFFFARLYAPISPVTNGLYFVTIALVIGYSYQDVHLALPGSPGFGFTIAWRRLVLVICGVVAAFLASLLPPSTTIRKYHRNLLSTTSAQLGSAYCAILSFACTKSDPEIQEIVSCLLATRAKLKRSVIIRTNIDYEFSLKGRWPKERYHKFVDLQISISYSLANLLSVLEHLEPAWARAFLRRTRFMDPDFQGDVLAVISMISSSLRTGSPLPQITPCPLLDRFLLQYHGLNVIHKEAGEDYGLPRSMTFDVLKNEQYLMFCVGTATAFRIITQLDQLMLATKEVVGEHYHIHGVGGHPVLKASPGPIVAQFQPPTGVDVV